ncbi:type 1 glutamine amidotransferase domain-containing protein [Roseibacillus ishigakijimensis]|uniref:Type 1 glutamine amidotransferase domain-containing protein n=1 Tax=Roseibacillus ishigakijimensis TaxID=454146 RepID=A0A934RR56_9BACT|nr:type 1 glutamine amidotransferase domain-containing protein [Roseibacillus ishigakijimensis]MBK1833938.1 type 1 glutamine amidotransferase domain-containing protein [Roseibacillus ishigakijimensis]
MIAKIAGITLAGFGLAAADNILLVLTNHGELGDTGKKTGFYLSEAAHPYQVFTEAGHEVILASPQGGSAPLDPKSLKLDDPANETFWKKFGNAKEDSPAVSDTVPLAEIEADEFAGIFFAGGHGTMWDFPHSEPLQALTRELYEAGKPVGAVCHGPAALVNVTLSNGKKLIADKSVAVFTNAEEEAVELTEVVPFLLQTKFAQAGAEVKEGANFQKNAVRDGLLITGQNPASAHQAGELFVEALSAE